MSGVQSRGCTPARRIGTRRAGVHAVVAIAVATLAVPLVAGGGAIAAASKSPYTIAVLSDESGALQEQFGPGVNGAYDFAKVLNAKGGIDGHPIVIKNYDDAGSATQTLANAQAAVAAGALGVAASEPFFSTAEPYLGQNTMPVAGVAFDATYFNYTTFYSLIGDDFSAAPVGVATEKYLIDVKHEKKIALVANDTPGTDAETQLSAAVVPKLGGTVVYTNYNVATTNTSALLAVAQAIKAAGAQGVIANVFSTEAPQLQVDLANAGSTAKVVEGILIENTYPQQFGSAVNGLSFEYTQAPPYDTAIPAIKTFISSMNKNYPKYTYSAIALTDYDSVAFLAYGMQLVADKHLPMTRKNIAKELNTLHANTINGLTAPLSFPYDRSHGDGCLAFVDIAHGKWVLSAGTPKNPFLCATVPSA